MKGSTRVGQQAVEAQVLGISFLRSHTQPVDDFLEFLKHRGHSVSQTKRSVSVSALTGSLEDMARELLELAREFDSNNGTLVANTLSLVWEFRECCANIGYCGESPVWADVFATEQWVSRGAWRALKPSGEHRKLSQVFARAKPTSLRKVVPPKPTEELKP